MDKRRKNLESYIISAYERTTKEGVFNNSINEIIVGIGICEIDKLPFEGWLIYDILECFPDLTDDDFKNAILNGSLEDEEHGITYKFSAHIICCWIREYIKQKNEL